MLRTRTSIPAGITASVSPTCTRPARAVPVATVPRPGSVKTRSTPKRNNPSSGCFGQLAAIECKCVRNAATPESSDAFATRGKIRAWASAVGANSASICAFTVRIRASSTRSILVKATAPWVIPSSSSIARCSRVCGITPSSAATTSSAKSIPPTPATIVWTRRS